MGSTPPQTLARTLTRRPSEDSEGHRLLQDRVTAYIQTLFLFMGAASVLGALSLWRLESLEAVVARVQHTSTQIQLVLLAILGLQWWYLRRALRPVGLLRGDEGAGTVIVCIAYALIARALPAGVPEFGLLMALGLTLVIRAAIVPSTAMRSMVVGSISVLAMLLVVGWRGTAVDVGAGERVPMWIVVAIWGSAFTAATMVVSRIIYGLHERVRAAMQLGQYTLVERLGGGGMGEVYLAKHALLRRPTAVKLLPPSRTEGLTLARFEREVRETSRLNHPNTVEIYDYGHTPEGIFYYAMEYLDGLDLDQLVTLDGPQPPGRVVYVIAQVAHALAEAHAIGLIHRDIKPANIVLCDRGGVADLAKVVDFGLVKDLNHEELQLSLANAIPGTPQYLSPEVIRGPGDIDGRVDLYALGAVAWFLLVGEEVFRGRTAVEICTQHLYTEAERPSARLGRALPSDVEEVVLRCLQKRPEDRFDDAIALREALLSCACADDWGLGEARRWWDQNAARVRAFQREIRQETTSPHGFRVVFAKRS